MDFIVKIKLDSTYKFKYSFCEEIKKVSVDLNNVYIEKLSHLDYVVDSNDIRTQIAIGDVIATDNSSSDLSKTKGIFYLLTFWNNSKGLSIECDEHSLLPLYYSKHDDYILVSSSFIILASNLAKKTYNSDFYAELAILYSQIDGSTFYKEIIRLEYGQIIDISQDFKVVRKKRFFDSFTKSPQSFNSSIEKISNAFIKTSKLYFNEPCAISLTGGFDGRTLTACAHFHHVEFTNFSYGKKGNGDVDNPLMIAKSLKLSYNLIELDNNYLSNSYQESVNDYLRLSGGFNGFQYPQSQYYVKKLAGENKIIITGYLGSEILSSTKGEDDEVCPKFVLDYLKSGSQNDDIIYTQENVLLELGLINDRQAVKEVLIKMRNYFLSLPDDLSLNQKFSTFAFENIYRNTFGTWIYNGMHIAKIRVPFLDHEFFSEISKTEVSQFYRPFLETNPIKRLKGQLLYSKILMKTWPQLNRITSSKGYAPADILTFYGRIKIALGRILKNNKYKEHHGLDKMSTNSGAIQYFEKENFDKALFNKEEIRILLQKNSISRSICFLSLSKTEFQKML